MSEKDKLIELLQAKIDRMARTLEAVKELPNDTPLCDFGAVETSVIAYLPYNLDALNATKEKLEAAGYKERQRCFNNENGKLCVSFYNHDKKQSIDVWLETKREGSTCKINQVGEKTVPIYETVCLQV